MKILTGIVSAALFSGCVASSKLRMGDEYLLNRYSPETPVVCGDANVAGKPDAPVCDASRTSDPNYPSRPPIKQAVTIYTEGDDPAELAQNDINGPIYTTFTVQGPDGRSDSSQIISAPVQIWPRPRKDYSPGSLGAVTHDDNGWPLPDLQGYTKVGELEGIVCEVNRKSLTLKAVMYEQEDRLITTYSDSARVIAYTAANVNEKLNGLFVVDGKGNGKFNMHSDDKTDLCTAVELSAIIRPIMDLKK